MWNIKDKVFSLVLWLKKPSNGLWLTPVFGAFFAVFLALVSTLIENRDLPLGALPNISETLVNDILSIVASSMLAVSTFSLSIMVSAFASASNSATPRSTELVMGDNTTRVAISSFISAFVYALVAKVTLGMGYYNEAGRFVLFVGTIGVLIYLIYTLINWVRALSQLGRLDNTLEKIELASYQALVDYWENPNMGAKGITDITLQKPIYAIKTGYLSHINLQGLQNFAEQNDCQIEIAIRPGKFVHTNMPIAYTDCVDEEKLAQIAEGFVFERNRSYAQDPKFGLIVLSEVAQRALSPAVNDPGTAIKVMTILMRLLLETQREKQEITYSNLAMLNLNEGDFITQPFSPISRDGESMVEIHIRMQKTLHALWQNASADTLRQSAKAQAEMDLAYAQNGLLLEQEKQRVQEIHQRLFG
ncbi:putative membrane protein [Pasteurella langaaensis DSM 22999]|uniref:Putative membrane protein n=1 Tax=Alitibacter langaaensis DSM 22999 TaxID=1122935 RepID=A0A2U0SM07_9PAST|nr:DUF2254 family protein [Pasteurella langaaensis]PVX32363.1 putative membrane protein [Pasteurella langaaensis DSM 22999]